MHREQRQKRFTYFRADATEAIKLQAALSAFVSHCDTLLQRKQDITVTEGSTVRTQLINHHEEDGFFFGEFLSFEAGKTPQALNPEAFDQEEVPLENLLDNLSDDQRREVIDGICYIGVLGEHIVMTQALSLGVRDFEGYLNRMLQASPDVPHGTVFQLVREVPASTQDKLKGAKSISIGSPLATVVTDTREHTDDKGGLKKRKKRMLLKDSRAIDAVKSITGCNLDEFTADDALDLASLKVQVDISYRRYSAKREENMIEDLSRALRDVPDDNLSIKLHNRGEIRGDKLFLWTMKSVEYIGGAAVRESVRQRMREWLRELSSQGTIS
ncbi:hypothetical protein [Algiphilus sp.]|uniref:hypothetical protein n=1 Tax=Algiphilus sp. TaxID=1872431 RepID=UPI0025C2F6B0|nr:hypothetical protein [Algiphilus sp.]MCK5772037.1 hypothetical protein [Algiphilus sp.]